jgi:hypothetical protein
MIMVTGLLAAGVTLLPAQTTVDISPSRDNTLYQDNGGALSNGAGEFIFVGNTNTSKVRRAVIAFDIAGAIPAGVIIESAELKLTLSKTRASSETVTLHRLNADWGEGSSHAAGEEGGGAASQQGDATWIHRFYNTELWTTPGGVFESTAAASVVVSTAGNYALGSTESMVANVQSWLDAPVTNFGWLIKGNESGSQTASRFNSKENSNVSGRPILRVTYTETPTGLEPSVPGRVMGTRFSVYPNPFTEQTTLRYNVLKLTEVNLKVCNILGQEIRNLVNEFQTQGEKSVTLDLSEMNKNAGGHGIYYAILTTGYDRQVIKLLQVR